MVVSKSLETALASYIPYSRLRFQQSASVLRKKYLRQLRQ